MMAEELENIENNEDKGSETVADFFEGTDQPFLTRAEILAIEEEEAKLELQNTPAAEGEQEKNIEAEAEDNTGDDFDDPTVWFNDRFRDKGVKINSIDEIPEIIAAYNNLLANKEPGVSPELLARQKLAVETGSWTMYDEIMSLDPSKMEAIDALREKFVIERSDLPRHLSLKLFDKDMKSREFDEEDADLQRALLESEGKKAKAWLESKKQSIAVVDNKQEQVDRAAEDAKWYKGVDEQINIIKANKDTIVFEMEDKTSVNVDVDQEDLEEIQNAMDSPIKWLSELIAKEGGGYDHSKLAQLIIKNNQFDRVASEFYQLGRVHQEEHILNKNKGGDQQKRTGPLRTEQTGRETIGNFFANL